MYEVIGGAKYRTMRVLWTLEELGQPYIHTPLAPRDTGVRDLNPLGKIPVLKVDGTVLTESVAIMSFLADRHEALTFAPGTVERARQDALMHYLVEAFDAVLWTGAKHKFALPAERRVPEVVNTVMWELQQSEAHLAEALGDGPYLMGETFTIADILAVHCLRWMSGAKFRLQNESLRTYRDRLSDRPALKRVLELP